MASYVIKPLIYNAMQWTGDNEQAIIDFVGVNENGDSRFRAPIDDQPAGLWYDAQGFWRTLNVTEWAVLTPYGSWQPFADADFTSTFELA